MHIDVYSQECLVKTLFFMKSNVILNQLTKDFNLDMEIVVSFSSVFSNLLQFNQSAFIPNVNQVYKQIN